MNAVKAAVILLLLACRAGAAEPTPADSEFFEKQVRPLLVAHCLECHGSKEQSGGLRLDARSSILTGGDLGPAVVPGDIGKSRLITAVRYGDENLQMPPERKLKETEVKILEEWVRRGAPWPGDTGAPPPAKPPGDMVFTEAHRSHWAWQPLVRPELPPGTPLGAHPIDAFLDARIDAAKLPRTERTDPPLLLRRLTFDLTGLPPSVEELDLFEKATDADPDAALRDAVERLLARPQYGERFARHWLDVARYADSNGSEVDHAMANAWRYRDYVVDAFNQDKAFDQFVREQIAGDLLEGGGPDALTATGFLMLGPKSLAELDKPKLAADIVDEQVDTVGRAFLGLTLGCCRCHDHKFDPLPTADYYALAGIFTSTRTMIDIHMRVGTWQERPLGAPADADRIAALMQRIADLQKERDASATYRPTPSLAKGAEYLVFEAETFARGNLRVDHTQLGRGIGVVRTRLEYPDHIEYEFILPEGGEYQLELRYAALESRPVELALNGNLEEMSAAAEVTGDWKPEAQRWFVQGRYRFRQGKNLLTIHRDGPVPLFDKLLIGRVSEQPHSRNVAAKPAQAPTADDKAVNARKQKLDAQIAEAQREVEQIPTVMAPFDGPVADTPILVRGNPGTPGAIVPRGFLRITGDLGAPKPTSHQSGRKELADWMTRRDHPLTARVIVNRVWQWHFGHGLVRTPDNFGLRGEAPSHPELLDWLAARFMDDGWSLKRLHTLICTSAAYQRASTSAVQAADPENTLLASFPRRRLSAEELRDAMLSASGQLDLTVGGKVMTVMNRTYAAGGNAPGDILKQMHYDTRRRSLYLPIVRTALFDLFAAFDYPDPGMLTGRRTQTTVAPQALFLMNSPFVKEQAAAVASQLARLEADDSRRLTAVWRLLFSRRPRPDELARAQQFLDAGDENDLWPQLCQMLFASNDFLYVK